MNITVEGVEYEPATELASNEPIYIPVIPEVGQLIVSEAFATELPRRSVRLWEGDTIAPFMIGATDHTGNRVSVTGGDYVCRAQMLDDKRELLGTERLITETVDASGIDYFVARMLISDAELINVETWMVPTVAYFSVEIESLAANFRRTSEVKLFVMTKPQ